MATQSSSSNGTNNQASLLTSLQQGVQAINNLTQALQATFPSS